MSPSLSLSLQLNFAFCKIVQSAGRFQASGRTYLFKQQRCGPNAHQITHNSHILILLRWTMLAIEYLFARHAHSRWAKCVAKCISFLSQCLLFSVLFCSFSVFSLTMLRWHNGLWSKLHGAPVMSTRYNHQLIGASSFNEHPSQRPPLARCHTLRFLFGRNLLGLSHQSICPIN